MSDRTHSRTRKTKFVVMFGKDVQAGVAYWTEAWSKLEAVQKVAEPQYWTQRMWIDEGREVPVEPTPHPDTHRERKRILDRNRVRRIDAMKKALDSDAIEFLEKLRNPDEP